MNARNYHGKQLRLTDLSSDLREVAIQSVIKIDAAMSKRTRQENLSAYKARPLHARINSVFIARYNRWINGDKYHIERMKTNRAYAETFINENLCLFTDTGEYLTFTKRGL